MQQRYGAYTKRTKRGEMIMTLEYLAEQKVKYQDKADYFKRIEFDGLATTFKGVVDLIGEMEEYIKEKENGEEV